MNAPFRVGQGFDLHQWAQGRKLALGGVDIPHEVGLLGHSDADALTHAIIDALLGALCLGDIGKHFPDTDPRYKDCDSLALLRETVRLVGDAGWSVGNIDSTVVTEAPKLAPYIPMMRERLAEAMGIEVEAVSVKATRTERVLFEPEKGLLAMATALLVRRAI